MPRTDISQRASSTARESSVPARDTQENSGTSDVFDCETNYATASPPPEPPVTPEAAVRFVALTLLMCPSTAATLSQRLW